MRKGGTHSDAIIKRLLLNGRSQREIAKECRVSPMTVRKVSSCLLLPNCKCGKPAGHKGWCFIRLARSPRMRSYRRERLPEHNRRIAAKYVKGRPQSAIHRQRISNALIGIPRGADSIETVTARADPLRLRRFHRLARLSIAHPAVRLDMRLDRGKEIHELCTLFSYTPDPCYALIMKERWEEERRYEIWRRSRMQLKEAA